jgi:hypothetical protein
LNEIASTVPATDITNVVQIKPHTCPSGDGNIQGSATSTRYPSLCQIDDWKDTLINDLPSIHLPDGSVNIKPTTAGPALIKPICSPVAPRRTAYTDWNASVLPARIPNHNTSQYSWRMFHFNVDVGS